VRRFTIGPERIDGTRVAFDREESHHLMRVLRLRPGDLVIAADGQGHDYTVRIDALGATASGTVVASRTPAVESPLAVSLLQGIAKGDKMETIVRAATELGVRRIVPVITERTVVRLDPARWRERARRWQRVAREASKQCGRPVVPEVDAPAPLAAVLAEAATAELRLCFWEEATEPLSSALRRVTAAPSAVQILVGPEGGLAPTEAAAAHEQGFTPVRLGPRVLRTETAGPAAVAILQSRFGDLA
jgi:16S rRNA (uracil1498-N3)-methyltransferase